MRGVLTLAGEGTRMLPWTRGLRKEFLPLYDRSENGGPVLKPVAHMVLETLIAAGVNDVTLVVGGKDLAFVQNYFTVDREFLTRHAHHAERLEETRRFYETLGGLRLRYAIQIVPRGFGDAVLQSEPYVGDSEFVLHAADAVLVERERGHLLRHMVDLRTREGLDAVLLVRPVEDPKRYGVVEGAEVGEEGGLTRLRVTGIVEKPSRPKTHWAATAAYVFKPRIFRELKAVQAEKREHELELTDAIQRTIAEGGSVAALVLAPKFGEWWSVGSPEGYYQALQRTRTQTRAGAPKGARRGKTRIPNA